MQTWFPPLLPSLRTLLRQIGSPLLFALALVLLSACRPSSDRASGVQLILSTTELGPGTTFQLRFDEPIAQPLADDAGEPSTSDSRPSIPSSTSPLVFDPPIPGSFTWTSSRSGVFTPSESLVLGTTYYARLRAGLKSQDGKLSRAHLTQRLATPSFGITASYGPGLSTNAFSEPEIKLWFNADVRPEQVAVHAKFTSGDGRFIPAVARRGTEFDDHGWWHSDGQPRTWQEQFNAASARLSTPSPALPPGEDDPPREIPNLVILSPVQPLTEGRDWKFALSAQVGSADGRYRSREPFQLHIGDVAPFTIQEATMHHELSRWPWLEIRFSKPLPLALTNTYIDWIRFEPFPGPLSAEVRGHSLLLAGPWQRGPDYTATILRGFPANEAFYLAESRSLRFFVPPIQPRLYLPAFSADQLATGTRSFPLLAVNVPKVRIRTKLIEPAAAVHALRGYQGYYSRYYSKDKRRLDYDLMPGRTTFDKTVDGSQQPDTAEEITLHWDALLQGQKTGVVFIETEQSPAPSYDQPATGAQAIVQVTDLGLVWKTAGSQVHAFVFSYKTGLPLPGVTVRLCSDENASLAEGVTDPSGLVAVPPATNAAWLVAQTADDLHVVRLHQSNIPTWSFEATRYRPENQAPRRIAFFLDRGAYRPGETVLAKAIVRDLTEKEMHIPAGLTGQVLCFDSRGRRFFETNVVLGPLGSCEAAIPLPLNARGEFSAAIRLPEADTSQLFQVADFQPPAFELKLHSLPAYGPQDPVELQVDARYFFGKPLDRAKARWWLSGQDQPFSPAGFDDFQFSRTDVETRWGRSSSSCTIEGQAELKAGASGPTNPLPSATLTLHPDAPYNLAAPQPRQFTFFAEVTDLNQQTIARSIGFTRHSSTLYLGLKRFNRVLQTGDPLPFEAVALRSDGQPWSQPVDAHFALYRVDWNTVRLQGAGRSVRYRSEPSLQKLKEFDSTIEASPGRATSPMGAEPSPHSTERPSYSLNPQPSLLAPEAGEYLLEITANDDQGNPVATSLPFNVAAQASLAWDYRNEFELKLVPDKTVYAPGDTALLLVKAPFSGQAWVTVERNRILRSFQTSLDGNAPAVRIPITGADAPNVFVSVTLLRGASQSPHQVPEPEYRTGYCELRVEDPDTRLQILVSPNSTNCWPGDPVVVDLDVRDANGSPAPDTEITLYAVDEGVLSLTDYSTPDLHALMFAPCALNVDSSISLSFLLPEDPARLRFQNKGYTGGGGGKEALRKRFLPCAFWAGSLRTDTHGKASARFNAPDSTTRYRLIAVAHNAQNQFGTGAASFAVSKPLILEPSLPLAANVGDRLLARAVILNQTETAAPVLVSLELDDKAHCQSCNLTNTVLVPAQGSATVDFPVVLSATGPAAWTWRARFALPAPAFTDAVRSSFQVGHASPLLREIQTLRLSTPQTNLLALVNPQLLTGSGTVTVHVATTRLVTLAAAIDHLLHYPYGCAEQTGSSLLPWIVLRQNPEILPFIGRNPAEADGASHAGIQRLLSMQTPSGGLAYWPGDSSPMPWASAYGAFVLAEARRAGLTVPDPEFNALLKYLGSTECMSFDAPETACLALAALASAGRPDAALHTRWFEQRDTLSPEHGALLALALARGETNKSLATTLLQAPLSKHLHPSRDPFGSSDRERAIRLLALLACDSASPETERLFQELRQDQKQGHWSTTQANAWVLLAMTDHVRTRDSAAAEASGSLLWGAQNSQFKLSPPQPLATYRFPLDTSVASLPLLLSSPVTNLFLQVLVESRLPAGRTSFQDNGFRLQRQYQKLDDQNRPQPAGSLEVGDRILVTLQLSSPQNARYVALDDPLPGILEAINPAFTTQQTAATDDGINIYLPTNYRELRADRVLFFADHLPAGDYAVRYLARVRAAGTATAPPARVEQMYSPDRFGLTDRVTLTSRPAQ